MWWWIWLAVFAVNVLVLWALHRRNKLEPVNIPETLFSSEFPTACLERRDFFAEPWEQHPRASGCVLLPSSLLIQMIDPAKVAAMWRTEAEKMEEIAASLESEGLREPLLIVMDEGRVALKDGHHRVAIADKSGGRSLPVEIRRSPGLRKMNIPLADLVEVLWSK